MHGLILNKSINEYHIDAACYKLIIDTQKASVKIILSGTNVATIDIRSAVNMTSDTNEEIIESEPNIPTFDSLTQDDNSCIFVWKNQSSFWTKEYQLICTPLRFIYKVKVFGSGRVDSVNYFSGDLSSAHKGSDYEFSEGFNPCISWYDHEDYYFKASQKNYRWSVLMVPPMHCYSFRTEGLSEQLALGVIAERGEHNFNSITYTPCTQAWRTSFYISTDQHGHTNVDGEWTAPSMIGYGAMDEFDAVKKYSDFYFTSGIAAPKKRVIPPRFWMGPMVCGWIDQCKTAYYDPSFAGNNGSNLACEAMYEKIVEKMRKYDLHPTALIIDDKWQKQYATAEVNTDKWPDLRAFIDRRHSEGIHTILWFKLWDPEGWPAELCVKADNGSVLLDPSQPKFIEHLDKLLYKLLSSDAGCYDCDGFKLDFAFIMPIGRGFKTYSSKYGCELLYEMMEHIYSKAKEIKPYALINCSPCHPYFAHICDQARLHDYAPQNRNNFEDLAMRAKMFQTAMPNTLLDTDNSGFSTRRDTMRWQLNQHEIGVPDLYCLTPDGDMTDDDFYAISYLWKEYGKRIDDSYSE